MKKNLTLDEPTLGDELAPLNVIRTETALSRFPIHRLSKRGAVQIEIRNQVSALLWEVTYNSKYGQPGPLAYKLDTLIVNRRIEKAGRPIPKLIRLGSLRDLCRELGNSEGGDSVQAIRKALLQNASAFVSAKFSYRGADKVERYAEIADTRYGVIFTGEKLPTGEEADAVYLILHDNYRAILDAAQTRPLDYDYMKTLPPSAQRFYEVVSYQIYAALHFQNERAKLRYSDYCLLSTATRYLDFDHVKKQMYKVHRPHLESGYLAKVSYEQTTDAAGQPDWFIYYLPGVNAAREFQEFTGSGRLKPKARERQAASAASRGESLLLPFAEFGDTPILRQVAPVPPHEDTNPLVEQLMAAELNRGDAERFAREKPEEARRQLDYLPYKKDLENPGAYLRAAIEGGYTAPKEYLQAKRREEQERKKREEAERKQAAEALKLAQEAAEATRIDESLAQLEKTQPEAFSAFLAYESKQRAELENRYKGMPTTIRAKMLAHLNTPDKRRELFQEWEKLP